MSELKSCSYCRKELPISLFCKDRGKKDGLHCWCKECKNLNLREWRKNNPDRKRAIAHKYLSKTKETVLKVYGNGVLACVVCGESRIDCLSIDHIEGNGAEHRKEIGNGSATLYRWLKLNNFPSGFQTLCMNCQFIKEAEVRKGGICHEKRVV